MSVDPVVLISHSSLLDTVVDLVEELGTLDVLSFSSSAETIPPQAAEIVTVGDTLVFQTNTTIISGGDEEVPYAKETDFVTDDIMYRGEAEPGTPASSPLWRIRKITIAPDGDVSEKWADGVATFTKVWDDRSSYQY